MNQPIFQQTLDFVKKLDEGLFTASAPYIFSTETYHGGSLPLMPSALSSIKSLDCIVPQSSVAVYPYPLGRTKDHAMLAAGSSAALGKVVLGHIETFGRSFVKGEKDPPVEFIKGQLLSASMTRGTRGASTFIYSYMLDRGESIIKQFDAAVKWQEVTSKFRNLFSPIGVYVPLNASHWPTVLVPFLRKIRRLGMDFSIIQLPLREAGRWAKSIRRDVKVLLLPDPLELSRSEVKFLNGYLREGNSIVVFGYPPRGIRSLLGVESRNVGKYGGG
ncbi:MAG: hypothetical protein ACUVQY_09825 [Thermoproteota archaeon]